VPIKYIAQKPMVIYQPIFFDAQKKTFLSVIFLVRYIFVAFPLSRGEAGALQRNDQPCKK
jgi:hypothetical protein